MKRIQRQRTKGWRTPEGAVYVGRPSRWGNGWRIGDRWADYEAEGLAWGAEITLDAAGAVRAYRSDLGLCSAAELSLILDPLRGHDLVCWCPEPCGEELALYEVTHGDQYESCAKPRGHEGGHDPSVPPWCHADVLLELLAESAP